MTEALWVSRVSRLSRLAILVCTIVSPFLPGAGFAEDEHEGTFWTGYLASLRLDPNWRGVGA